VEIKGYRREDAKEKKSTMDTYWVPGVNNLGTFGRWSFAEFTDVYLIEADFAAKVEREFSQMVEHVSGRPFTSFTLARNRSEAIVLRQFGRDPRISCVTRGIWETIESSKDSGFRLSDISSVALQNLCAPDEVLAVLAILSAPDTSTLRLQLRLHENRNTEISAAEFRTKLKDWWRRKTVSNAEWNHWASTVDVQWVPFEPSGERV
jgi:hypothetical protein